MRNSQTDTVTKSVKTSERDMLEYLRQSPEYGPLSLSLVLDEPDTTLGGLCDALVEMRWDSKKASYAVETKAAWQPAVIRQAALEVEQAARELQVLPMVYVPYLSDEALDMLGERNVSGIDLCGNCVVLNDSFSVWRSGAPNRFRDKRPIRNPYSGDSSIIARCFLLQPEYQSLTALQEFALSRICGQQPEDAEALRLGTVSKVVQALQDDLIVAKDREGIRLVARARLIERLRERYRPDQMNRLLGKTPLTRDQVWARLQETRRDGALRSVATGIASAGWYGVLEGVERLSFYVDDLAAASDLLEVTEGRAFANVELVESDKNLVFFDCRVEDDVIWASVIQTWLELAQGGAREQEAAQDLAGLRLGGGEEESR